MLTAGIPDVLEHFNLREVINRAQEDPNNVKCVETRVTRLLGDKGPERVVCAGGYQILVLVPGAFKDKNLVSEGDALTGIGR